MQVIHETNVEETATNKPDAVTAFNLNAASTQTNGLRNFAVAYADTENAPYFASDGAGLWESGLGTFTAGTPDTLVRNTILESSNAGAAVDFSAGGDVVLHVEWSANLANLVSKTIDNGYTEITGDGVNSTALLVNQFTKITNFNVVNYNPYTWWDTANNRFLPDRAGWYRVKIVFGFNDGNVLNRGIFNLYKNGVFFEGLGTITKSSNKGDCLVNSSVELFLNGSTDYVELFVHQAVSINSYNIPEYVKFVAKYIGE